GDTRGCSRGTARLGRVRTVEWLRDGLGEMSDCVLDRDGVLVDYTGDELMALWGAPEGQPDHARRACRAALDMLARLPRLNEKWLPVLGEETGLGVGVSTGPAQVGNVGSEHKFKYGALGETVNLASRVQGATKHLKVPLLITGPTRQELGDEFAVRRLCLVRVVNMRQPVVLYELAPTGVAGWADLKGRYEAALAAFEGGDLRTAAGSLGGLVS